MTTEDLKQKPKEQNIGTSGLIIFDGSCGSCTTFIGEKSAFFKKYGFTVTPLQEPWVKETTKLSEETLLRAIHLYKPDGQIVKGIDFFQVIATKVWWLKPLSIILSISILKPLFTLLYDAIAQRRRRLSQVCGLQKRAIYK